VLPLLRVTLGELYRGFFYAGARGFGGALPWTRRMLVEERRWLTDQEFLDVFSLCNFLPGPNVVNVSVIIGARFHGVAGALTAVAGLLSLPLAASLTLAALYARFSHVAGVDAVLRGVGAAAIGFVTAMGLRMTLALPRTPQTLGFLLATFAAIALARLPLVPVLVVLAALSVAAAWRRRA
jgi:chromate transporter